MRETAVDKPGIEHAGQKDDKWNDALPVHTQHYLTHVTSAFSRVVPAKEWRVAVCVCNHNAQDMSQTNKTMRMIR